MTITPKVNTYAIGVGTSSTVPPIIAQRAPTATDIRYPIGQRWINQTSTNVYTLVSLSVSNGIASALWNNDSPGTGSLNTLDGDSGSATPSAGVITIAGTSNEITTAGSSHTVTLSIPSTFVAPGTVTSTG